MTAADDRYSAAMADAREKYPDFDWFAFDEIVGERMSEAERFASVSYSEGHILDLVRAERDWLRELVDRLTRDARTEEGDRG